MSEMNEKLYPEDRCITQLQSIKGQAISLISQINNSIEYFEIHKKDFEEERKRATT